MAEYEYIKYIIRNKEPLRIADDSTSQSGQTVTLRYIPGTTMRGYIINKMAPSSDFEQLKEVIVAALPNCNPDAVTPEAQLVPDVCADSLDTVELSMAIEDKLGVSMPDGLMATFLTVNDLLTYLKENK